MIGKPNRPGFHTITPYLMVQDVDASITFVEEAFGATERFRTTGGAGGTHVEVQIGDSMLMLGGGNETVQAQRADAQPPLLSTSFRLISLAIPTRPKSR